METRNNELEMFTFAEIKDEFIGEIGSEKRTQYEQELQLEVMRKNQNTLKTYTLEEVTDKYIGKKGTKKRDEFEKELRRH
ncbi:MAG: hypothetical protein ABI378_11825 [Chitinophagaceae bacterium]